MAANVYVSVSGPVLSFLLYENVKSLGDQEGFLLGDIESHVKDTISDSQMCGEKTETVINVYSLMPLPSSFTFYNSAGRLNVEKLKAFLKDKRKEVVGWYRFRRNSELTPHMREKIVHKQLSSAMSHMPPDLFTMCLLSFSVSNTGSTHLFDHIFVRYKHSTFEALPLRIHNLGETSQTEYKLVPSAACTSDSFQKIVTSLNAEHNIVPAAQLVTRIQQALQNHLQDLVHNVELSEARMATLQKEVDSLREQLASGHISNEKLLPDLLMDGDKMNVDVNVSLDNNLEPEKDRRESLKNNVIAEKGQNNSSLSEEDPFAFITEVKLQMSQPMESQSKENDSSECHDVDNSLRKDSQETARSPEISGRKGKGKVVGGRSSPVSRKQVRNSSTVNSEHAPSPKQPLSQHYINGSKSNEENVLPKQMANRGAITRSKSGNFHKE